jgi:hypothetical protein
MFSALNDENFEKTNNLLHEDSPLYQVSESDFEDIDYSVESVEVVDEDTPYNADEADNVQEFETVEAEVTESANGNSETVTYSVLVARNSNDEWKVALLGVGGGISGSEQPPSVSFDFNYNRSAGELIISVVGGQSVDASKVSVEGADSDANWGTDTLRPGSSATVSVEGGDSVSVVWTTNFGRSQELASYDVPG